MTQTALIFEPPLPEPERPLTLQERFDRWLAHNPGVYAEVVRRARTAKLAGATRIGMKLIFESIRWDVMVRVVSDNYRMDNSFASRFARLVIDREPDLADMFETRERRAS